MKIFRSPCCIQVPSRPDSCTGGWMQLLAEKEILIVVASLVVHCCVIKKNVIVASRLYHVADVHFTVEQCFSSGVPRNLRVPGVPPKQTEVLGTKLPTTVVCGCSNATVSQYRCHYESHWKLCLSIALTYCSLCVTKPYAIGFHELRNICGGFLCSQKVEKHCSKEGLLELLQFIQKYNLGNSVPNVVIMLRIFLTIDVSVATCDKSFSKLKLIKNYLRSSMSTLWLRSLAALSIEQHLTDNMNFDFAIEEFTNNKARKVTV